MTVLCTFLVIASRAAAKQSIPLFRIASPFRLAMTKIFFDPTSSGFNRRALKPAGKRIECGGNAISR